MLVLSRRRGEQIVIGDQISVEIMEIRGDRVKLGFVGPRDVPIHRAEIWSRIRDERAESRVLTTTTEYGREVA